MKSHPRRISTTKALPTGSQRVTHPRLGIRCWQINGKYYRSRNDFLIPRFKIVDGQRVAVDMSIPE